jgi:carbonyl reductase 1
MSESRDAGSPVAIVTGANRDPGIGFEITRALSQRMPVGTTVVLTSRDAEMGREAAEKLKAESFNVTHHQLDISTAESVTALRDFVRDSLGGGIDVLVNNAGLAFPLQSTVPFPDQARQTIDVNYYGTKRMIRELQPLMRPGCRVVGVSSMSGNLGKGWSEQMRQRMLAPDLTVEGLDVIAEEFVAAAAEGKHQEAGFRGSAYGTSKALMTQLHRVLAKEAAPPALLTAVCPGLCRTYMATGRGTFMSNVLWAASFLVGHSAAGGADTPVWLCCELPAAEIPNFHGKFVKARAVQDY